MTAEIYTLINELKGFISAGTEFRPAKIIKIKDFIFINIDFSPVELDRAKEIDNNKISINFRKNNFRALINILEKKKIKKIINNGKR